MSALTIEQYEQLPDFLTDDYEKDGESFIHKGLKKVKQTANSLDEKGKQTAKELADYKEQEQVRIKAAEQKAYDKAIADGNIEAITARHNEQIEHTKLSSFEAGKLEAQAEFTTQQSKAKGDNIALKLASDIGVDEFAVDMLQRELRGRIEVDGENIIFLDASGRATTLTQSEFKTDILNNPRYSRLLKGDMSTTGGGKADGSTGGSATNKKFSDYSGAELIAIKNQNPAEYERLKSTR